MRSKVSHSAEVGGTNNKKEKKGRNKIAWEMEKEKPMQRRNEYTLSTTNVS